MKKDVDKGILNENDINSSFKKTYNILKNMNHINEINDSDDSEDEELINNQIMIFSEKYKNLEEEEMVNKFLFDKKIYYSIKKDIENEEIYESDIPTKFNKKYLVYKTLDENNQIEDDDIKYTSDNDNLLLQFQTFIDMYEEIKEDNKYVPHNINYIDKKKDNEELESDTEFELPLKDNINN